MPSEQKIIIDAPWRMHREGTYYWVSVLTGTGRTDPGNNLEPLGSKLKTITMCNLEVLAYKHVEKRSRN